MAARATRNTVRATILDRLVLDDSRAPSPNVRLEEFKASVARDLEWMLNTRLWHRWGLAAFEEGTKPLVDGGREDDGEWVEAGRSLLLYGLPDLSGFSLVCPDDEQLQELIRETIERCEPRFQRGSVVCEVLDSTDGTSGQLRIRIEARLQVHPITEKVVFDSSLDLASTDLRIEHVQ